MMTERKLKRVLCKRHWFLALGAVILTVLTLIILAYNILTGFDEMIVYDMLFWLAPLTLTVDALWIDRIYRRKTNRKMFKDSDVLKNAVDEYNSPEAIKVGNKRKPNALTQSYVFVLSEQMVLRYDEIAKAHIIQHSKLIRGGRTAKLTDKFTLITKDECQSDLFKVTDMETVEKVVKHIMERNPECKASCEIEEIKRS